MSELHSTVENEISKMQTMLALTKQQGPTDTEAKQETAIQQMAYESSLHQLNERLKLTGTVFQRKTQYLKEMRRWSLELVIEGRAIVTRPGVSVSAKGAGQAWVDAGKAIGHVVNKK